MTPEIFLVAPMTADTSGLPALLEEVLDAAPVAALLLPAGPHDEAGYEALARAVLPVVQDRGCAVLLDNTPELARKLDADGVHMSTGIKAFKQAAGLLKPGRIVGAGALHSRHDAMQKGEADADYVFFGTLTGPVSDTARADAAWWAETFEIPAVYCDPEAPLENLDTAGCEFVGLSGNLWDAPEGPAAALATLAGRLEAAQ